MTYRLTRDARADLDDIWDYTAKTWAEDQAEVYNSKLVETFARAVASPLTGRDRSSMVQDMRSLTSGRHVVFYRRLDGEVVILRIVHQRRDMRRTQFGE